MSNNPQPIYVADPERIRVAELEKARLVKPGRQPQARQLPPAQAAPAPSPEAVPPHTFTWRPYWGWMREREHRAREQDQLRQRDEARARLSSQPGAVSPIPQPFILGGVQQPDTRDEATVIGDGLLQLAQVLARRRRT
jgi:hypothetical protein